MVALEDGTVPEGVVAMLRNFSALDLTLIAGRAIGLGANAALVRQAVEAAAGAGTASPTAQADPTTIRLLQAQINRFFVGSFGIAQQMAETGVIDAETVAQLPRAAQIALDIAGPLDLSAIATLAPAAAANLNAQGIAQNASALVDAFTRIIIPAAEDAAIAEQATVELVHEDISAEQRPKIVAAAAQAAAQVKAQGGSQAEQQAAARTAAQQAVVATKKKFFDVKNPKFWVAVGGGVAAVVVIGAAIKLFARRPAVMVTRAAR